MSVQPGTQQSVENLIVVFSLLSIYTWCLKAINCTRRAQFGVLFYHLEKTVQNNWRIEQKKKLNGGVFINRTWTQIDEK